jgi:hypothetical protein
MIISCNLVLIGQLVSEEKMEKGKIAVAGNLVFYRMYTKITNFSSGPSYDCHCPIDLSYSMEY